MIEWCSFSDPSLTTCYMLGIVPRTKSLRGAKGDMGFPGSAVVKNWPADAGDKEKWVWPWVRKSLLGRKWLPTPVFLLGENSTDRGIWRATAHGVAKSRTWLSRHVHGREQIILLLCTEVCHDYKNQNGLYVWKEIYSKQSKGGVKWRSFSCDRLCDPMDYTVHGILQAILLEWEAFPFSRG